MNELIGPMILGPAEEKDLSTLSRTELKMYASRYDELNKFAHSKKAATYIQSMLENYLIDCFVNLFQMKSGEYTLYPSNSTIQKIKFNNIK